MEKSKTKSRRKHTEHQSASSKNDDDVVVAITDVPDQILMEICSTLSAKSICRFRSVCKHLFNLLTSPDFVQLHFDRSPVCPLICPCARPKRSYLYRHTRFSKSRLSLFEFKRDRIFSAGSSNLLNLTAFKLPQRGPRFSYGLNCVNVVNSCNGYICLEAKLKNDTYRIAIYNPVTSEYSLLPIPENLSTSTKDDQVSVCGLGYCPDSNQYKVLIFVNVQLGSCTTCFTQWFICKAKVGLIYTLGLKGGGGGWREIKSPPCCSQCSSSSIHPVFFNGALHWIGQTVETRIYGAVASTKNCIMSFDFEGEQFRILQEPPCLNSNRSLLLNMTLGVRRGRLYLCVDTNLIDMWVMNDYGVENSWTKEMHVDDVKSLSERRSFGLKPISNLFNNWDLLYFSSGRKSIYFINEHHHSIRYVKIGETARFDSDLKVFAHVPSFIPLKNIVGDSLEVLKFGST